MKKAGLRDEVQLFFFLPIMNSKSNIREVYGNS